MCMQKYNMYDIYALNSIYAFLCQFFTCIRERCMILRENIAFIRDSFVAIYDALFLGGDTLKYFVFNE